MIQSQECMKVNKMTIQTMTTHQNIILKTHDNIQTTQVEENNESDEYMTIKDINITSEMNASNRESENAEDREIEIWTNARYNLRPRPKSTVQFALAQSDEQSIVLPKTHAHIMMTQLNIKDGLIIKRDKTTTYTTSTYAMQ